MLHTDLCVLTNDEHWTITPEALKHAAAAESFCFVTAANGEQQDVYNLPPVPCVQRSLCLDEVIDDSGSTQVEFPKRVDSQTRDMLERCMATCGKAAGARTKRRSAATCFGQTALGQSIQRCPRPKPNWPEAALAQKGHYQEILCKASDQEARGHCKQFAEARRIT